MDKQPQPKIEEMRVTGVILFFIVGGLVTFILALVYFLGLAWLLTVLAPLTYAQATAVAVMVAGSTLLVVARMPAFEFLLVLMSLAAGAVLAVVEVFLARLVVWLTPLALWEASLLMAAIGALSLFLFSLIIANDVAENEDFDDLENDDSEAILYGLAPDMYLLKPSFDKPSKPKRRRTSRKSSTKKIDDTDTD